MISKKVVLSSALVIIALTFTFFCFLMFIYTTTLRVKIKDTCEYLGYMQGITIASTEENNGHGQVTIPLDSLAKLGKVDNLETKEVLKAVLLESVSDIESVLLILFIVGLIIIIFGGFLIRNYFKVNSVPSLPKQFTSSSL